MDQRFQEIIKNIPQKPGVYRYYTEDNLLLYVGKAKKLKARVSSYFQDGRPKNQRLTLMISQIYRIEYTVVETEKESLLLEANLIHNLQPKYNILLKSDQSFSFVRITNDPIPGVYIVRRKYDPNSRYYGPYTKKVGIYNSLRTLRQIFPYCQEKISKGIFCNYYKIGLCDGICGGEETIENYNKKISQIESVLKGKTDGVIDYLNIKIKEAVDIGNFELASLWRDRMLYLNLAISDQKIILAEPMDIDLVSILLEKEDSEGYQIASVFVQNIRDGRIINVNNFILSGTVEEGENADFEYATRFLQNYFAQTQPECLVLLHVYNLDDDVIEKKILEIEQTQFISELIEGKVTQRNTSKVNHKSITDLMIQGKQNALIYLERNKLGHRLSIFEENNLFKTVVNLKESLSLKEIPRRIECYDISHLSGTHVYGSMVVFIDGRPSKSNYRLFKTTERNDDFANHAEVLERRFERCFVWYGEHEESEWVKNPWKLPNLMIIDGGKGQLSGDLEIINKQKNRFREAGFPFGLEVCSLAKREEEIFLPGIGGSVRLKGDELFLVQRIRDEAHRFAITNNRKARLKDVQKSELDNIAGIGPVTKRKLLLTFGSVKSLGDALFNNQEMVHEVVGDVITEKLKKHFGVIG
jgi:excinuclease ABC subunit C